MSFFFGMFQVFCWFVAGYNFALNKNWQTAAFILLAVIFGLIQATSDIGKVLRERNSN